jgi:integrase
MPIVHSLLRLPARSNRFFATRFRLTISAPYDRGKRYRMLFVLMAKTGMRPGEAIALQPGDVDGGQHTIRIERAATLGGQVKSTKTAEVRLVDLSAKLIPKLEAYRAWLELESMTGRWGDTPWLCPNDQGRLYEERHLRRVFHRILHRANLPSFRVYDLRHTYASLLLSSGVPLLYVSQQLGHTNPTTTLRYYARWIPTGDQRYVDVLDAAAEKTWHQTLAPEAMDDQKPLNSGVVHHRRPMMMNHQPLIPDALEEIRG